MHGEEAVSKAEVTTRSKERRAELSPAAQRALAEAEARRREAAQRPEPPEELGGRGGPDPARYGDWEVNGIASDF
ncbi:DUF1674 domain-containing protein [Methylocystis sp.]|jgi:hypothetical protein|uniref:DUF1674 domain-containing protein n=1 Tax=Methylocystis sp. TaxID=1911079 RepID=UPI003D0B4FB0